MKPIAALRTDGGTAFCRDCGQHEWLGAWNRLVEMLQRERSIADEAFERREGLRVALPVPRVNGQGELDFHEVESVQDFAGPRPLAEVTIDGPRRERLTFHVPDRAFIRFDEKGDPDTGELRWRVRVEAKARELYADGLERWVSRWLGLCTWLTSGTWPALDELAPRFGWRTTQWHVNSDFSGIDFDDEDARRFVGVRKYTKHGRGPTIAEQALRGIVDQRIVESTIASPWVQTLVLGRKSSDSQLVIYRKGDQIREAKRMDPEKFFYAPLWKANGWDPTADGDPLRVELRLRKKGLQYKGADGRDLWDFRDPMMLLKHQAVRELWWHHTFKRRLILPQSATRKKRAKGDPRWEVVRGVGVPRFDARQIPREVRELTRDERIARDVYDALQAAVKWSARSGIAAETYSDVGDALVAMGRRLQRGEARSLLCPLVAEPDLGAAVERAAASTQFFRKQAQANTEGMADELDAARGHHVERARIWNDDEGDEESGDRRTETENE